MGGLWLGAQLAVAEAFLCTIFKLVIFIFSRFIFLDKAGGQG